MFDEEWGHDANPDMQAVEHASKLGDKVEPEHGSQSRAARPGESEDPMSR